MNTKTRTLAAVCAAAALVATAFAGRPAANGGPTKLLRMPTVSGRQQSHVPDRQDVPSDDQFGWLISFDVVEHGRAVIVPALARDENPP